MTGRSPLRVFVLAWALVASAASACSKFGEDTSSVSGADSGATDDAEAADGARGDETGATADASSPCSATTDPWDLCEDFDTDPAPAPGAWTELAGGSTAIALTVTAEQSTSAPRSLRVFAPMSPNSGAAKYFEAKIAAGTSRGITCRLAVRAEAISTGDTQVLWLRFPTAAGSSFAFGQAGVWLKDNGGQPTVYGRAQSIAPDGGGGDLVTTDALPIGAAWTDITIAVDFAAATLRLVAGAQAETVVSIPDLRPLAELVVRVGATTNPPTAPTTIFLDDVACRRIP